MKAGKSSLLLAAFILLAFTGAAHANDYRQVWRDSEGSIVRNTTGNCVRSMWIINDDPCAEGPHTILSREERTVYFAFNKSELTDESKQKLNSLAGKLEPADDVDGAHIVGFADRIGTIRYNEMLSKKRANTVRDYLIAHGFIKPSETQTQWVGKSEPTAQCPNDLPHDKLVECLQPDRKVTVEIDYSSKSGDAPAPGSDCDNPAPAGDTE